MSKPLQRGNVRGNAQNNGHDDDLVTQGEQLLVVLRGLQNEVKVCVRQSVAPQGQMPDSARLRRMSASTHPLVWMATYIEAMTALNHWAKELRNGDRFHAAEQLIYAVGMADYTSKIFNGIPIGLVEVVSLAELGLDEATITRYRQEAYALPLAHKTDNATKGRLFDTLRHFMQDTTQPVLPVWVMGDAGYSPSLRHFCRKVRSFLHEKVEPYVQAWHLADTRIPLDVIALFAKAGLLDLSVDRTQKGHDRSTVIAVLEEIAASSMTLASYVRHHSLAIGLVRSAGTAEQKKRWLAPLVSGEALCALTFTEMCSGAIGEDLRLRAHADGSQYRIHGAKNGVSNMTRADLLFALARTSRNAQEGSFFVLEKSRTTEEDPFPRRGVKGLSGVMVQTAGHRGLGHYDIDFDDVAVPSNNLLGGVEHLSSRQLILVQEQDCLNAAAQSIGLGRAALETVLRSVMENEIIDKSHDMTSREKNKVALMAVHLMVARQLCRMTAQAKDADCSGHIRAGMAKLLASRVAWQAADTALQLEGGAGIAVDNPVLRLWLDARTIGLMECPAEFICRRLLEDNPLNTLPA